MSKYSRPNRVRDPAEERERDVKSSRERKKHIKTVLFFIFYFFIIIKEKSSHRQKASQMHRVHTCAHASIFSPAMALYISTPNAVPFLNHLHFADSIRTKTYSKPKNQIQSKKKTKTQKKGGKYPVRFTLRPSVSWKLAPQFRF